MITIKGQAESSIVIKKSKFLGLACRINNEQEAQDFLTQRRKQHYDATHNCFAYVLENGIMRYSDDGEPQGTAGLPMLEVIKRSGLSNVLTVSTRYFGGTLLGAGGLVRAYTQSASSSLEEAQKVKVVPCSVFSCDFAYNIWDKAERRLRDAGYALSEIQYLTEVNVQISVDDGEEDALNEMVTSLTLGKSQLIPLGQKRVERNI